MRWSLVGCEFRGLIRFWRYKIGIVIRQSAMKKPTRTVTWRERECGPGHRNSPLVAVVVCGDQLLLTTFSVSARPQRTEAFLHLSRS